jgi:DNA-binding CsgD family transcriptional regulator
VRVLLEGLDTRAIAGRMFLSPYTVNDHLKSIFTKVDVRNRKELVATFAASPGVTTP